MVWESDIALTQRLFRSDLEPTVQGTWKPVEKSQPLLSSPPSVERCILPENWTQYLENIERDFSPSLRSKLFFLTDKKKKPRGHK